LWVENFTEMLTIYHNTRCKNSRYGLEYLSSKTNDFVIRDYLKQPITQNELNEILLKSNLKPIDLVRTQEEYFKKTLKDKNFTNEEWIKILIENPKLIKRPIVVGKLKATVAIPATEIDKLIR
jgi:arsenate reductase (glutaredoxin)